MSYSPRIAPIAGLYFTRAASTYSDREEQLLSTLVSLLHKTRELNATETRSFVSQILPIAAELHKLRISKGISRQSEIDTLVREISHNAFLFPEDSQEAMHKRLEKLRADLAKSKD